MDGYVRVSQVGKRDVDSESYQTEDVQRAKIEGWAALRNVEIVAWHIDRDQSGAKLSRPGFDECMARIEAGATDGIVVAQIDRLSRADVADALMTIRSIHDEHGGTVAAVDLGIDPTTEVGEMLLTVLLALARMQWRRYQAAWATSRERAHERGAQLTKAPLGYRHAADGAGRLEPDPRLGPLVSKAFDIAAARGIKPAQLFLQEHDAGAPVNRWSLPTVRRTLARRVYLGETEWAGTTTREAHEALTDLATWTRAQSAAPGRAPAGDYPLSGVACCKTCGTAMVGTRSKGRRMYRCGSGGGLSNPVQCDRRAWARADELEQFILALTLIELEARQSDPETYPEVLPEQPVPASVEAEERAMLDAVARRDEFVGADLEVAPAMWAGRAQVLDEAVTAAEQVYRDALEAAGPRTVLPRSVELSGAGVLGVPDALERMGISLHVAPGRRPLAERVALRP
jgi:DNA invertase Pin-like site-specific DNA recombinase